MSTDHWQTTWEIFHRACELEGEERASYLEEACGDDGELLASIEELLAGVEENPGFLEGSSVLDSLLAEDDQSGRVIDDYQLDRPLGDGGMGMVYAARQLRPIKRSVAIKLIKPGMDTREVIARFEAERQTLARLDHPNIARIFGAGSTDRGRPYFVMELVEGDGLIAYCDHHRLDTGQRLELFVAICRAVHHAHQKGVLHRDLKPSNILVQDVDGVATPKVIDFGIARALDPSHRQHSVFTRLGQFIGTPEYMSPEQAEGSLNLDVRSDIYSLGVVLYELLAGCLPFAPEQLRGKTPEHVREVIRREEPRRPSTRISVPDAETQRDVAERRRTDPVDLVKRLRGDLDWITMRTLEKDPERRYGAASELADEIERHLRHEPVLAGPPSAGYRMVKFVRRHRLAVAGGGALAAMILALAAVWVVQSIKVRRALVQVEQEAERADQVATFLIDLFRISDPREALGEEILAREVLDRGAVRIGEELADDPELRAELEGVMGEVYYTLGLFERSEELLDASFERSRLLHAPEDEPFILARLRLAILYTWQARYRESEILLRSSLRTLESLEDQDYYLGVTLNQLGYVLFELDEDEEAEQLLRRALALRRPPDREPYPDASLILGHLGRLLSKQGRLQEAEDALTESRDIALRLAGPRHPSYLTALSNLAGVIGKAGRRQESTEIYREILDIEIELFGKGHPKVHTAYSNLALAVDRQGDYQKAESLFREALGLMEANGRQERPQYVATLSSLGALLRHQGRLEEAEKILREAVERARRLWGSAGRSRLTEPLNNLAVALERQGKFEGVEKLYLETLDIYRGTIGTENAQFATTLSNLGVFYRRLGDHDKAEKAYLEALAIERRVLGPRHGNVAMRLQNLAVLERRRGNYESSETYAREAVDVYVEALGKDHANTGSGRASLGETLLLHGRADDAEPELREALRVLKHNGIEGRSPLSAQIALGEALTAQGRLDEAEELLRDALETIERRDPLDPEVTNRAFESLARLYSQTGREREAAALRARKFTGSP